jgi:hypothetical protein
MLFNIIDKTFQFKNPCRHQKRGPHRPHSAAVLAPLEQGEGEGPQQPLVRLPRALRRVGVGRKYSPTDDT